MNEVLRLHGKGFHLVPWLNRNAIERKPLVAGFTEATYSVSTLEGFIAKWPDADWAIVPRGFVVLDVDVKTTDGKAELEALCLANGTTVQQLTETCPKTKTFSGGFHFYFSTKETQLSSCHIGDALELKHLNSVHVPPSQGYFWLKELDSIEALPPLPDWLGRMWVAKSQSKKGDQQFLQPRFANGSRHSAMVSFAGKARDALALSEVELTEVLKIVRRTRCDDPDTVEDKELSKIAEDMAKFSPTDVQGLALAGDEGAQSVMDIFARPVSLCEPAPGSVAAFREEVLPEHLLHPTPMIKMWVEWINSTNHRPQPELALAGVLSGIGIMVRRNTRWFTGRANIFTLGLAHTISGKQACVTGVETVMKAAGYGEMIGFGDFGTNVGLHEQLAGKPEMIMVVDEFNSFIEKVSSQNVQTYHAQISMQLLKLYNGSLPGNAKKESVSEKIENAHFSLCAFAQPTQFWTSCTQRMIEQGFIGRMHIFVGRRLPTQRLIRTFPEIPPELLTLIGKGAKRAETLTARQANDPSSGLFELKDDGTAAETLKELTENFEINYMQKYAKVEKNDFKTAVYGRTIEKILRLAIIHAWSIDPSDPVVTSEGLNWAYEVTMYCNRVTYEGLSDHKASNATEEFTSKVLSLIKRAGPDGISRNAIAEQTRMIGRNARITILQDLTENGFISEFKLKLQPGRGAAQIMYRLPAPQSIQEQSHQAEISA